MNSAAQDTPLEILSKAGVDISRIPDGEIERLWFFYRLPLENNPPPDDAPLWYGILGSVAILMLGILTPLPIYILSAIAGLTLGVCIRSIVQLRIKKRREIDYLRAAHLTIRNYWESYSQ